MRYDDIIRDYEIDKIIESQRDYEYCGPRDFYKEYLRGSYRSPMEAYEKYFGDPLEVPIDNYNEKDEEEQK